MSGQPPVEARLRVEVGHLLQVQDAAGVGIGSPLPQRSQVGDGVVHPAQPHDDEDLRPPARPARPGGVVSLLERWRAAWVVGAITKGPV